LRLLESKEGEHFASIDTGLRGYKARHNLAVIYHETARPSDAEREWRAALAERPDFVPAWPGLAELYLMCGQWVELEETATRLEATPTAGVEGVVLRARGHLAQREFTPARRLLEETIERSPRALWPRVVLSHVLLQEGRDWAAAEAALQNVLSLDPAHAEARRNLAILRQQQGRAAG